MWVLNNFYNMFFKMEMFKIINEDSFIDGQHIGEK